MNEITTLSDSKYTSDVVERGLHGNFSFSESNACLVLDLRKLHSLYHSYEHFYFAKEMVRTNKC